MADARFTAFGVLSKMQKDNSYSNLLLADVLKAADLSYNDKMLAHRIVKTVLERKITIDWNLSLYLSRPMKKLKPQVLTVLRLGASQILFMSKIPHSAAINESVKIIKKCGCSFASGIVNAVLRKLSQNGLVLPEEKDKIKFLSVKYSFPEYITKIFADYYGEENAEKIMASSVGDGKIYLRKNSLKSEELSIGNEKCEFPENCHILSESGDISQKEDFRQGRFHIQDLSSQLCAFVLSPEKGETVVDVCSAPGGKSMTMAQMMHNCGKIIACDIHGHKLALINDTVKRLGIDIVETRLRDGTDKEALLPEADRILCDVPCSGFGVTGKKPEIKYKEEQEISSLPALQLEILENSAKYLKVGGRLVYSTCTLLPAENENVVNEFLTKNKNFRALPIDEKIKGIRMGEALTVMPYDYDCDGFFIALLERIE